MDEAKGLLVFMLVFAVLAVAGIGIANQNQIMPTVAEAQAGAAIGTKSVMALEKGASLFLKLLAGSVVAGVTAAVFSEVRKAYSLWKRNARSGRWQSGPNANFQKTPKTPSEPRLTRQDLILLALGARGQMGITGLGVNGKKQAKQPDDDELNIEM